MKRKRLERGHWDAVISNYKEVELVDLPFTLSSLSVQAIERVRDHLVQTHFTCPRRRSSGRSSSGRFDGCCCRRHGDGRGEEEEEKEHGHDGDDGATLVTWLNCHAIYLSKHGMLSAHVDSVKFSGDIVAGLSLKSACIMRLKPVVSTTTTSSSSDEGNGKEENLMQVTRGETGGERGEKEGFVDLYLPPRSLYVLSGVYRYSYTHEILPSGSSFQFGSSSSSSNGETIQVDRDDRLSIIFRDAL
jgi:alkylated DNA repair protein alkB family protein 7